VVPDSISGMSISDLSSHRPGADPAGALAEAVTAVRGLDQTWWTSQSDEVLVSVVEQVQALRSALAAVEAGAVAEADARDLAKHRLHHASTGAWLTHVGGRHRGDGRRLLARARALTGPLQATREALADGQVSPEQSDVIVRSIDDLPLGEAVRARGELALIEHAGSLDASELARTGRHLAHVVDPDATDRRLEAQLARDERAAHHGRYLALTFDQAGGVRVKGRGCAEDGALLRAALLPLTTPAPAVDDHHGQEGQALHDPRDHGARLWDALITTAQHAVTTGLPPDSHGAPARLLVTVSLHALTDALTDTLADTAVAGLTGAVGICEDGTELSAGTVRRLACDAELLPAVLGRHGEPLDVGRTRRPVTAAIWAALVLRDRHCTFPGCTRPPAMCHAHHIHPWALGGETKLSNLVLLCGHHHRVIHDSPWKVRINPADHHPEYHPPPKPGIRTRWIRHRPRRE